MQRNKQAYFWNKKAHSYPIYDAREDSSAKKLLEKLGQKGVEFGGKRVLDIGCGTGRNTIEIAKIAASVDALDISGEMLALLDKSAKEQGVSNIRTVQSCFMDADLQGRYDIVIATMTPALQALEDFGKALSLAGEKFVYVGWGRTRSAPLLEKAFLLHGGKLHLPFGAPGAKEHFGKLGYSVVVEYSEEVWEHETPLEKAIEEMCWHIEIGGVEPDRSIVEKLLKSEFGDMVKHSHNVETGLIICEI